MTALSDELVEFAVDLRAAGVAVEPGRLAVAAAGLAAFDVLDRDEIYWATRLAFCARAADIPLFDAVFDNRFAGPADIPETELEAGAGELVAELPGSPAPEQAKESDLWGDSDSTVSDRVARHEERALTAAERARFDEITEVLASGRRRRRSMRTVPARRGRIDLSRTVRTMLSHGGELAPLRRRRAVDKTRPLVVIVDVSNSMRDHSDLLLRFAHCAMRADPDHTEVFTLGTRCTRVTEALRVRDPESAMRRIDDQETRRGGGTRLGESLKVLLRGWAGRSGLRSAVVVIGSDGWDLDDPPVMATQMERLSQLVHCVVWANPQNDRPAFEAMAPGLLAALPYVDLHTAGHDVEALYELAELISR
jgi:uncharacterized protein with von Willebrand factor type A (vWA) domain